MPLTMLYESTCGTFAKTSFPSSPWGSKFPVAKFGRTEAIKQNSKTRSSKLSCKHQQARILFTIEGATPIEVTVPSNVITLATPPAKRHRMCHTTWILAVRGWWERSTAPATDLLRAQEPTSGKPQSKSFANTGSATWPWRHGRHEAAHLSCKTSKDYSQISQFTPTSPFVWSFSANLLQVMQDPDMGLIDTAESGFHTDVFEPIQFSGIWHRQTAEAKEDLPFEVYDTNRKSAEEDPDTVSRLIQEDVDANFRSGDRSSQKALAKGRGSGPPQRCQAGPARPACLLGQLDTECQIGKSLANRAWRTSSQTSDGVCLTIDVSKAQRRLRIREDEWRLLVFQR